jgi:N-acetylmuramic acid 6-phosphate etherase
MLRLGRVYRGMMVNMPPTNAKLKRRAEAMVAEIAHCDPSHAASSLEQADGDIKTAVLLALGVDKADAEAVLKDCDGNLRRVFAELAKDGDKDRETAPAPPQGGAV